MEIGRRAPSPDRAAGAQTAQHSPQPAQIATYALPTSSSDEFLPAGVQLLSDGLRQHLLTMVVRDSDVRQRCPCAHSPEAARGSFPSGQSTAMSCRNPEIPCRHQGQERPSLGVRLSCMGLAWSLTLKAAFMSEAPHPQRRTANPATEPGRSRVRWTPSASGTEENNAHRNLLRCTMAQRSRIIVIR